MKRKLVENIGMYRIEEDGIRESGSTRDENFILRWKRRRGRWW